MTPTPTPSIAPYLFFDGHCEDALAFYQKALGAEVVALMRFKENPDTATGDGCAGGNLPAPMAEKVMHAAFRIGHSLIMASDGNCTGKPTFSGISLSLSLATAADVERCFQALAEGGQVQMPLAETFFAQRFGMVADRFGVSWMLIAERPAAR